MARCEDFPDTIHDDEIPTSEVNSKKPLSQAVKRTHQRKRS